MLKEAGVAQSV